MSKTYLDADMDAELEEMEKEEGDDEGVEEEDNDSDEDTDEEEDKEDPEVLKQISSYQEEITQNPYNYSAHLSLVTLLRKTEYFEKLREARKTFSQFYPLTSELWVEWINDEQKIASSEEEKKFIVSLFVKGVEDYVSVDLWLEYCQFSIGGTGTEEGISQARDVFEKAITSCGRNIAKASHIWDAYREFEGILLSMLPSEGTPEQLEAHSDQRKKVENIFRRQLRLPLQGMSGTLTEYKAFVGGDVDPNTVSEFQKANQKLKSRQKFEDKLLGEDKEECYLEYLQFELKEKDPVMIQQLYERAITDNCLNESFWLDYLSYLEFSLKLPEISLRVYKRAIRNIPWCLTVWCDYLRALERYNQPASEVRQVFEQALSSGLSAQGSYLELWLCFIDYKRRKTVWETEVTESMSELRNVFEKANIHLAKCNDDPEFEVSKYWANLEADQFGMMGNARKIWSEITLADPIRASVWMEFVQLEKTFGDKKHLRRAYQRAVEKSEDTPEIIVKSFIQFEREEGSLEAYEEAKKLCKIKMEKISARRGKEAALRSEEERLKEEKIEKKKEKDKQQRRDRRHQLAAEKRGPESNNEPGTATFLKPKVPEPASNKKVSPPPGFPGSKKAVPPPPGFNENRKRAVDPPPGFTQPDSKKVKMSDYESQSDEEQRKMRTVYVSNLDFSLTEEELRQCLESSGPIMDVRLVKKPTGESRGFAFVEYEKYEDAEAALERDRELLGGRPMFLSVCDAEKKAPVFKFEKGLEKNKLFVSSLDPSVTREELQEIFGKFGKLVEVRVPTYRNGHAKGIAFVDFEDELSAATALVKADNMTIKTKAIQVALSNPPKRKDEGSASSADVKSLGGTEAKDFGPRGKGRSQLAFTPRSISVPSKPPTKLEPMKFVKSKDTENGSHGNGDTNGGAKTGKSNAQFRQLLNKQ